MRHFLRGLRWCALCVAPVALLQPLWFGIKHSEGLPSLGDLLQVLLILPGSFLVLLGGQSVVTVFEDNVKDWTGHRRDTMFDNMDVFLGLVSVQTLLLALLLAWRYRRGATRRDPVVVGVGLFLVVNALLAIDWMWFGT